MVYSVSEASQKCPYQTWILRARPCLVLWPINSIYKSAQFIPKSSSPKELIKCTRVSREQGVAGAVNWAAYFVGTTRSDAQRAIRHDVALLKMGYIVTAFWNLQPLSIILFTAYSLWWKTKILSSSRFSKDVHCLKSAMGLILDREKKVSSKSWSIWLLLTFEAGWKSQNQSQQGRIVNRGRPLAMKVK